MATAKQKKAQLRFKKAAVKAKKLYKTGRYSKYSDAMKAALSGIGGRTRATGRSNKKPARSAKVTQTVKISGIGSISLGSLLGEAKKRHKDAIDKLVVRKYHCTTKRDRSKIQKQINEHNAALRRL
jgi:hypothetical protein